MLSAEDKDDDDDRVRQKFDWLRPFEFFSVVYQILRLKHRHYLRPNVERVSAAICADSP